MTLGITKRVKQEISRKTGIPMPKQGMEQKAGKAVVDFLKGK